MTVRSADTARMGAADGMIIPAFMLECADDGKHCVGCNDDLAMTMGSPDAVRYGRSGRFGPNGDDGSATE